MSLPPRRLPQASLNGSMEEASEEPLLPRGEGGQPHSCTYIPADAAPAKSSRYKTLPETCPALTAPGVYSGHDRTSSAPGRPRGSNAIKSEDAREKERHGMSKKRTENDKQREARRLVEAKPPIRPAALSRRRHSPPAPAPRWQRPAPCRGRRRCGLPRPDPAPAPYPNQTAAQASCPRAPSP